MLREGMEGEVVAGAGWLALNCVQIQNWVIVESYYEE